ncbi:helix-turn-helix transcriptional regulator [Oenococcus oeni]|uniref:helix-turn-helix domain-containing protein n=1 Tax=Oenococcus oeni TaxID=1247 RepID=UPI00050DDDF5|nr:helix-turn-helix transcriptional regulator [Oenococcus oeni]KGH73713.1 hypothetical protein X280_01955 [Oenococcus oeni IOEB_0502]
MIRELSLGAARKNVRLSQDEVTKLIKNTLDQRVSRQRLSRWESKDYNDMPIDIAFYLSKLYKMPFDALFYSTS